jgi:hypothetical protein
MKEKKTNVDDNNHHHRVFFTFDKDHLIKFSTNQNRGNLATQLSIHKRGIYEVTRPNMEPDKRTILCHMKTRICSFRLSITST